MHHQTRLRQSRLAAGYSQVEVAHILQLKSHAPVSRWEHGERLPSTQRLLELSALYQRQANELLLPQYHDAAAYIQRRKLAALRRKQ